MIELARFLLIAEAVLGIDAERLALTIKLGSAESALALPDGNKRVALLLMENYLEDEGWRFAASAPEIDRTFRALAGRAMSEDEFHEWLVSRSQRTRD